MTQAIDIHNRRMVAYWKLPNHIPATTLMEFTSRDLDRLACASDRESYQKILAHILSRIRRT